RARGEHDVAGLEPRITHRKLTRASEARHSLKGVDTRLAILARALARHRIGEGAFERDEIGPIDRGLPTNAPIREPPRRPHRLGTRYQHLLGITAAQRTGPAERPEVDDGDAAAGLPHPGGHTRGCGAAANDDEIVALVHASGASQQA